MHIWKNNFLARRYFRKYFKNIGNIREEMKEFLKKDDIFSYLIIKNCKVYNIYHKKMVYFLLFYLGKLIFVIDR